MASDHPYYSIPDAAGFTNGASGAIVVGSDLVLVWGYGEEPGLYDGAGFFINACDSSGNHLQTLVFIPAERDGVRSSVAQAYNLLPQAIDAAVRLFPNYLLTPQS